MANITLTSAVPVDPSQAQYGIAGEAINDGQLVYIDYANSGVLKLAASTEDEDDLRRFSVGMAVNSGTAGQYVSYIPFTGNPLIITNSNGLAVGTVLFLSNTFGLMSGDLADFDSLCLTIVGIVMDNTHIKLGLLQGPLYSV